MPSGKDKEMAREKVSAKRKKYNTNKKVENYVKSIMGI